MRLHFDIAANLVTQEKKFIVKGVTWKEERTWWLELYMVKLLKASKQSNNKRELSKA